MLKGEVKIQLFDALTGRETDRVEGPNIITNAAHYLLNGCPYSLDRRTWGNSSATMATDWSQIYSKVFGGILVFPETITESAAHIFEPLSHYPVGYGSMLGQDTNDPKSGTFNAVESGPIIEGGITVGYQYVYDFGTSQANGTWTTVCLSSAKGGYGYIEGRNDGNIFDSLFHRNIGISTSYIGSTSGYLYFIDEAYGTATLSRLKIPAYKVPLYGNDIMGMPVTVMTVNDTDRLFIDQANDCIYKLAIGDVVLGERTLTITKYNDEDDLTDTTVYTLTLAEALVPVYNRGRYDFCIRDGYLYMGNRGTKVLKVNLTSAADYDEIAVSQHTHSYSTIGMSILSTGDIYRFPEIIDENDVPHTIGGADVTGPTIDFDVPFNNWSVCNKGNYGYAASINTTYLASIKVLPNPVPKNAQKTGKIKYILREAS